MALYNRALGTENPTDMTTEVWKAEIMVIVKAFINVQQTFPHQACPRHRKKRQERALTIAVSDRMDRFWQPIKSLS